MDERFEVFVRAALPELVRFGTAVSGNRQDAEDLVQSALEATGRRWAKVSAQGGDPTAYVKRAVVNSYVSRWRRRRREWLTDQPLPESVPTVPVMAENRPFAEREMWIALEQLPPRQRAVLVLRYYEDLSEADIAEVLGCRPGTVKSQASKALATLRRLLTEESETTERESTDEHA